MNENLNLAEMLKDCPAQYSKDGHPALKWDLCKTTIKDISTDMEHWVKPEVSHIVIDFDFKESRNLPGQSFQPFLNLKLYLLFLLLCKRIL